MLNRDGMSMEPAPGTTGPGDYFAHARPELVALIPAHARRILDVGCGTGALGRLLKETRRQESVHVTGIEPSVAAADEARRYLDEVLGADADELEMRFGARFDCVVLGDVLEHLRDPWNLLRKVRPWVARNGAVVASVPNVQQWRVIKNLALGRWTYSAEGILDATHLRFFTRQTVRTLFESTGFSVQSIAPNSLGRRGRLLSLVTAGTADAFCAPQFLIVAVPSPDAEV